MAPRTVAFLLTVTFIGPRICMAVNDLATGISAPAGFEVSLFADDDLAHDIFSLTIDGRGDVVVSGPGYVRVLLDQDRDGQADSFRTFADSPASGAQGLFFDGNHLLCTGDGGLLLYRDDDGDGRSDGPPQCLLTLKTGGEHFAHAVVQGPDGWWYVMLGNLAGIGRAQVTGISSPVIDPTAGTLLRIAPDYSSTEVIADGYRNPYDFTFHATGDLFTFDSDGERDVSLPWYRPTRVFQVMPGMHAGWVTPNWKRPNYFPDMPAVMVDCGRGSPTGVVAYRHTQFPARYRDNLFVLDWTFGRVLAVSLTPEASHMRGSVQTFLSTNGQFGFAPTDLAVTPAGDLMISVGGRGTRGGVYRVTYQGDKDEQAQDMSEQTADQPLTACLTALQPLSSWSRARWTPWARSLGEQVLVAAALDPSRSERQRIRAIEIVTQLYGGFEFVHLQHLVHDHSEAVRARTAWSLGLGALDHEGFDLLNILLRDDDPRVIRIALEGALRNASQQDVAILLPQLTQLLDADDRFVRQAAGLVIERLSPLQQLYPFRHLPSASARCRSAYVLAVTDRHSKYNLFEFSQSLSAFLAALDAEEQLEALRAAQKSLGDVGGSEGLPPVYDGYANQLDLTTVSLDLTELIARFPLADHNANWELARLLALLAPRSGELADRLAGMLSDSSHPLHDIHYLIALSRLAVLPQQDRRNRVAESLVALEYKLQRYNLKQDRNWDLRIGELYQQLGIHDPLLAARVVSDPRFGLPGHVILARDLAPPLCADAADRIADFLAKEPDTLWTNDVIYLLSKSERPAHLKLIRERFDDFALRGAVIAALAQQPLETDRDKFLTGLRSTDATVLRSSVEALEQLARSDAAADQFALFKAWTSLGVDTRYQKLRTRIEKLLIRNLDYDLHRAADEMSSSGDLASGWRELLERRYPEEVRVELESQEQQQSILMANLQEVDWDSGQVARGLRLFQTKACHSCHNTRAAVGPDLTGIGTRFSRDDLFVAIAFPSRDVSPRYATSMIETTRGTVLTGLIIYESVDGVTLLDSTNQTIRVEADEIEYRQPITTSLMPTGLLDDMTLEDLADLYAYLRSL